MFVWGPKELNKKQSDAVVDDGNVLLVACPGSGKTRTLTYKIAYEISKLKNTKQYIVAITYTNRAADEIKERIEILGVATKQLWIGTIHSFCLDWILRPYSLYLPYLTKGFRIIDSFDTERIITEICNRYNTTNNLSGQNKIKFYDCSFYATKDCLFRLTSQNLSKSKKEGVKTIIKEYFKTLKKNNQIDFEHILTDSLKLLKQNKIITDILSRIIPFILIDEYQDTKEIQYHIIASILDSGGQKTKLFIVGDPNQSIYQSLGGYPIEKSELESLCNLEIKPKELADNYRSSNRIIEYFDYFKTFDNNIEAKGKDRNYKSLITLNNVVEKKDVIDEIASLIELNIKTYGISQNEICIAAPQWVHIASVTRKLMLKLPDYSFDGPGMAPFAKDIDNFWYKLSRIVLTEPSPNMYIQRLRWSNEVLKELDSVGVSLYDYDSKKFLQLCNSIEFDEENGLEYLKLFFSKIAESLFFDITAHPKLKEHYDSFFNSSQSRIERIKKEGLDFIDNIESFRKVFKQRNGITVSTYHGTKGAEFDTMIVFALFHGYIPHWYDSAGQENSKKLLYVLASRARKNLHLIAGKQWFNNFNSEYVLTEHIRNYNYSYDEEY